MTTTEADTAAEIGTHLDSSDETAIEIATAVAEAYTKQIADYRDHFDRSRAKRQAELERFREVEKAIRRIDRGWSALSDRELEARSREERLRARWARNKRISRARAAKAAPSAPAMVPTIITSETLNDRLVKAHGIDDHSRAGR